MRTILAILVMVLLSQAAPALCSDEVAHQVAFPMLCGGVGLTVGEAPQVVWGSAWDSPGRDVILTTSECFVTTDCGLDNRNAANRLGMKIRVVPQTVPIARGEERWDGLFGDTLRVVLDLSRMPAQAPPPIGGPLDDVVQQTVDCMMMNAVRDAHRPRYLDVLVEGSEVFERLEGTYSLDAIPRPTRYDGPTSFWRTLKGPPNPPLQPAGAARRPG